MQGNLKVKPRAGLASLVVVLVMSTGMFLIAPHLKFGPENWAPFASVSIRLAAVIAVLIGWALWTLWSQHRLRRMSLDEETLNSPDTAGRSRPGRAPAAARLDQVQITEMLRGKSGHGKFSPYARPWYLVIGLKGAGKEALLAQSGLGISRVGHARSGGEFSGPGSRWWVSDEAVFIDTAGIPECTDKSPQGDECYWNVLIDTLRLYRRRRPVNGVVITIDFGELLRNSEDERAAFALTLRRSLRNLTARLKVELPVYLVCTKMDTVPGFLDFFVGAGLDEREQVWGVSLSRREAGEVMALEFLNGKLKALSASLYARMPARLNREMDSNRRCEILAFPRHFAGARNVVAIFARDVFKSAGSDSQPCLRGIYFTAAEPVVVEQAGRLFPSIFEGSQVVDQTSKSFFVRKLFQDLILAEADISGSDYKYEKVLVWSRRAAIMLAATLCISAGIAWASVTSRHEQVVEYFSGQLDQYEQQWERDAPGDSPGRLTQALDTLWEAVEGLRESSPRNWNSAGLSDFRLAKEAREMYLRELHGFLLPELLVALEDELTESREDDEVYETLRTYLMFGRLEYLQRDRVLEWFTKYWHKRGVDLQAQVALAGHLERLLAAPLESSNLNGQLVANAQERISQIPVANRIYEHIRRRPEHRREIDLVNHLGVSPQLVFKIELQKRLHLQVPFFFTREGQQAFALALKSPQVAAMAGEAWVLGEARDRTAELRAADFQALRHEVAALYAREYVKVWDEVIDAVDLVDIQSLQQLDMLLRNLQDSRQSALWNLLRLVAMHTAPGTLLQEDAGALGSRLLKDLGAEKLGQPVDSTGTNVEQNVLNKAGGILNGTEHFAVVESRFRELNRRAGTEMGTDVAAGGLADHLRALHAWIAEISGAADPGARAFSAAAARYNDASGNPAMALHDYAQSFPAPVRNWLERLADESWRLVTSSARQHLSAAWTMQVYEPYRRTLQGRYPLSSAAAEEVALHDFVQFFKSGGILDQYYQDYLAPFIVSNGQWSNRAVDRQSLGIPPTLLRQLQHAQRIRDAFFRNHDGSVSMTLNLRPHAMDENDARFTMEVGDERLTYSHGPRFWTALTWEATSENLLIRLAFEDLQGRWYHHDYHGVWAWLRLLDASYVERTADQSAYLVTFAMGDHAQSPENRQKIVYEIKTQGLDNPLRRDLLTTLKLPAGF